MINQQFAMGFPMVFLGFSGPQAPGRCFEEMLSQGCQGDVASFSSLVHACAKGNQLPRAEAWIQRMEEAGSHGTSWLAGFSLGNMQFLMQMNNDE